MKDMIAKTDEEYWKQFGEVVEDGDVVGMQNHEINLDVVIKFRGLNGGVIYEVREKEINCNVESLNTFFNNLKKSIRMIDETICDKETGDGGM